MKCVYIIGYIYNIYIHKITDDLNLKNISQHLFR